MKSKKTKNKSSSTENTQAVRSTDQEMVRKILERYIDKPVHIVPYERVLAPDWDFLFLDTSLLELSGQPSGVQQVNQIVKTGLKKFIYSHSLEDIIQRLDPYCTFGFLREAKEYLSTDDFSRMFRLASEKIGFCYDIYVDMDEVLELFKCCNLQKFMTAEERKKWEQLKRQPTGSVSVYRCYSEAGDENAVNWATNPSAPIKDDRFGVIYDDYVGYRAEINEDDVIAIIYDYWEIYILDPDKLQDIECIDLRDDCDWDELDEADWEGWEE